MPNITQSLLHAIHSFVAIIYDVPYRTKFCCGKLWRINTEIMLKSKTLGKFIAANMYRRLRRV